MNYLKQVLAFNKTQKINPLSAGQFMLWHALMDINNECAWSEWFDIAVNRLELFTGMSRGGVERARVRLKELGLIDFKSNGRNRATSYKIIKLYDEENTKKDVVENTSVQSSAQSSTQSSIQSSTQSSIQSSTQCSTQCSIQSGIQSSTQSSALLNKQNINKNKININNISSSSINNNIYNARERENETASASARDIQNNEKTCLTDVLASGGVNIPKDKKTPAEALKNADEAQKQTVVAFYEQNIGVLNSYTIQNLMYWVEDLNGELVLEALKIAVKNNAKNLKYVESILKSWVQKGYTKLVHVKQEQAEFEQCKMQSSTQSSIQSKRHKNVKVIKMSEEEKQALNDVDVPLNESKKTELLAKLRGDA